MMIAKYEAGIERWPVFKLQWMHPLMSLGQPAINLKFWVSHLLAACLLSPRLLAEEILDQLMETDRSSLRKKPVEVHHGFREITEEFREYTSN